MLTPTPPRVAVARLLPLQVQRPDPAAREQGLGAAGAVSDRPGGQVAVLTDRGLVALGQAAPGHVAAVRQLLLDRLTPAQVRQLRRIAEAIAG